MEPDSSKAREHLSHAAEESIARACLQFEAAWKKGERPQIEEHTSNRSTPESAAQFYELLRIDVRYRKLSDETPCLEEYAKRFPEHMDTIENAFAEMEETVVREVSSASHADKVTESIQWDTEDRGWHPTAAPRQIGRYEVLESIGEGGFGSVYLAIDRQLDRSVAIKVLQARRSRDPSHVEQFLAEARTLASLDHPNIVNVYDIGQTEGDRYYIVSRFVRGGDLAKVMRQQRPSFQESAAILAKVADALQYAHGRKLIHRDIKPANILIDELQQPHVADFGLALRDEDFGRVADCAGTPAYMSPEQARGEGHLVDGRSDVYSLGVVLYELLTGERPFAAPSRQELLIRIAWMEPRPPRQLDGSIPIEMERICLKALAKKVSDRYPTALDMAEDLRHYLEHDLPGTKEVDPTTTAARLVPKGLRSFDEMDAEFFSRLLPGPRDRDGVPAALRFWKSRIEETDPDKTFRIGVVYGPSGCGKSSMVKAGLLPLLASFVKCVLIEADGVDDTSRLLNSIRKTNDRLGSDLHLVETVSNLRRGAVSPSGVKTLIVLDQFEQWLHSNRDQSEDDLITALRQCDGERVQCLILVRDDFWMATTRFMQQLDEPIIEGGNSVAVDLFDLRHGRQVLTEFGQAFNQLPDDPQEFNKEHERFLDQATEELARDGKIIPVRLALFAEMVKSKPWTSATMKEYGGAEGMTLTFLEETFSSTSAPIEHRRHQQAARAVLAALLPEGNVSIKGHMRSHSELLELSGYKDRPDDFKTLLRILDSETRLITPMESESAMPSSHGALSGAPVQEQFYHLTHDYLVQPLREWVTRKKRETRRGRAQLLLADRADLWNAKRENQRLPTWWEYITICLNTQRRERSDEQVEMMRVATRQYMTRAACLLGLIIILVGLGIEVRGRMQADALMSALPTANPITLLSEKNDANIPGKIQPFLYHRRWVEPHLDSLLEEQSDGTSPTSEIDQAQLNAAIVKLYIDGTQVEDLENAMLYAAPDLLLALRETLETNGRLRPERFYDQLQNGYRDSAYRLRVAGILAGTPSRDGFQLSGHAAEIANALVAEMLQHPSHYDAWVEVFEPARSMLLPPLVEIYRDSSRRASEISWATDFLMSFSDVDDVEFLVELLIDASPDQFGKVLPVCADSPTRTVAALHKKMKRRPQSEEERERFAQQSARAAIALIRLEDSGKVWPLLRHSADPRLRSYFVNSIQPYGVEPSVLIKQVGEEEDVSIRRAMILALGDFDFETLPPDERATFFEILLNWYANDNDAGVHGAVEWVCRKWNRGDRLAKIDRNFATGTVERERRWYRTKHNNHTLVVLRPLKPFYTGSPRGPEWMSTWEDQLQRVINRKFAIGSKEVTIRQFLEFNDVHGYEDKYATHNECPVNKVSWVDAARYCNWLSHQEGIPQDEWCFLIEGDQVTLPNDYLRRTGYRLATEPEWEFACRAGAETSRYFGETRELLRKYEWYNDSEYPTLYPVSMPVGLLKPNDYGLFDMLGNLAEWCQQTPKVNDPTIDPKPFEDVEDNYYFGPTEHVVTTDERRAVRAGKFTDVPIYLRCSHRLQGQPYNGYHNVGFRIARTLSSEEAESAPSTTGESNN